MLPNVGQRSLGAFWWFSPRELILKTIHGCIMLKIHGLPPHFHTIFLNGIFNLVNAIFKNASAFLLPNLQKGCFSKCWPSGCLIFYGFHLFGASGSNLTMQLVMNDTPYCGNSTIWVVWHICTTWQSTSITNIHDLDEHLQHTSML